MESEYSLKISYDFLKQQSSNFLAPVTSFMEDSFSMDGAGVWGEGEPWAGPGVDIHLTDFCP